MVPIIDYGGVALVIPKIVAVGNTYEKGGRFNFDIFMEGFANPFVVGFDKTAEAQESRNELVAIIAEYYYEAEFGPEYDIDACDCDYDECDDEEEKH